MFLCLNYTFSIANLFLVLSCGHLCPSLCSVACPPAEHCPECNGSRATEAIIYIPECQHIVKVRELDAKNGLAYKLSPSGNVISINEDVEPSILTNPSCLCGTPCASIERYTLVNQLKEFSETFDHILGKLGRRVSRFAAGVEQLGERLSDSFETFVKDIHPAPLTASRNTRLLLSRDMEVLDLQHQIINYRTHVVDRLDSNLLALHHNLACVPSYTLVFHLRLDVLEIRAISIRLYDNLRVAAHLLILKDLSNGVQRQARKILEFCISQCETCLVDCQSAIENAKIDDIPSIGCEVRLYQVQFELLCRKARQILSHFALLPKGNNIDNGTLMSSLATVLDITRHFSSVNPMVIEIAGLYRTLIETESLAKEPVPRIPRGERRPVESKWGYHELGHVTVCPKKHPYSLKTFPEIFGCPECGQKVELADEEFREKSKHLRENDFLAAMHRMSVRDKLSL